MEVHFLLSAIHLQKATNDLNIFICERVVYAAWVPEVNDNAKQSDEKRNTGIPSSLCLWLWDKSLHICNIVCTEWFFYYFLYVLWFTIEIAFFLFVFFFLVKISFYSPPWIGVYLITNPMATHFWIFIFNLLSAFLVLSNRIRLKVFPFCC